MGAQGDRARAPRRPAAHDGGADRVERGDGALAGWHARASRRGADRGERPRDPDGRGPRRVRCSDAPHRLGYARGAHGRDGGGGAGDRGRDRISGDPSPVVHARRDRWGCRLQSRRIRGARRARARALAGAHHAHRAQRARVERVRARSDARRPRQRGDRLLDREHRPDGGSYRRQRLRGAPADLERPGLPGAPRPGDRRDPRGGSTDGRLKRPIRG